ncbi:hypothetical protein FcAc13_04305 [Frischella sp. Ac13]|uniref:Uncharacterized protein n=1 Tax=Frischella japonica TaxID=2741544 RepID=A0ABR7QWF2_9GAMM|nr:hypothetical protein [Frischella japonica]
MWRTELKLSLKQYLIFSGFYLVFIILLMASFYQTSLDDFTSIAIVLLIIEWWRACCYSSKMCGELALFYHIGQIYWSRQRWNVIKKPLFLHYFVIINLQSRRNGKYGILFLTYDNLSYQDWRGLYYFLKLFYNN